MAASGRRCRIASPPFASEGKKLLPEAETLSESLAGGR